MFSDDKSTSSLFSDLIRAEEEALSIRNKLVEKHQYSSLSRLNSDLFYLYTKNLPFITIEIGHDGNLLYLSKLAQKISGYNSSDIGSGLSAIKLLPERYHSRFWDLLSKKDDGKSYGPFEIECSGKENQVFPISLILVPTLNENNEQVFRGVAFDITRRHQAQENQFKVDRLFKEVIEASKDAIIVINKSGRITLFNPSAEKMFGWTKSSVLGEHLDIILPNDFKTRHRENVSGFFSTGKPNAAIGKTLELVAVRKDGISFPIDLTLSLSEDKDEPLVIAIIRDISERKKNEIALKESQERFETLLSATDSGILIHEKGIILDVNKRLEEMSGYSYNELVGMSSFNLLQPDDHSDPIDLSSSTNVFYYLNGIRKDGSLYPVEAHGKEIPYSGRKVRVVELRDITDRKIVEERNTILTSVIEQNPASVIITDSNSLITYVNPAFTRITGYLLSEVIGKNPNILRSGTNPPELYTDMWAKLSRGHSWRGEICNKKKDGSLFWELATIAPVLDVKGNITHFVAIKEDVTESREMEEKLLQAQKMDAIGRLAGGIAHDFNNLLTAITGNAELAALATDTEDPRLQHLDDIINTAERASDLTHQLLTFSKKQIIQPKIVNLNNIINNIYRLLKRVIGENIQLQVLCGPHLKNIKADGSQIEQIIVNLSVNARDAMSKGGSLSIETSNVYLMKDQFPTVKGLLEGNYVKLTVTDTGDGISEEDLGKIFEPFFSTKEQGKGTGLGLATVYGIVKQHHGTLRVHSLIGEGTSFDIYFPAVASNLSEEINDNMESRNLNGSESILIVEDETAVRTMIAKTLLRFGYTVMEAENGVEGVKKLHQLESPIDLILTDVIMPKMNGPEFINEATTLYPNISVLYMSGYAEQTMFKDGQQSPDIHFISKPFQPKKLVRTIRNILDEPAD